MVNRTDLDNPQTWATFKAFILALWDQSAAAQGYQVSAGNSSVAAANSAAAAAISTAAAAVSATAAGNSSNLALGATAVSGKLFATVAAGLAASVATQSFAAISPDGLELVSYTNTGGVAVEAGRIKSSTFMNSLGFDLSYSARTGYAAVWLDSNGAIALGIRNDGHVILGYGGDIVSSIAANTAALLTLPTQSDTSFNRSGYSMAWEDAQGNVAGGLDAAGNLVTKGVNLNDTLLGASGYARSGYVWAVQDSQGSVAMGLDPAGNLLLKGLPVGGANAAQLAQIAANTRWITPTGFFASGDSLTAGAGGTPYPTQLAALLNKPVTNYGIGGQTAQNISGRFGGSVPFVTITGNTIPASGAVAVTAQTLQIHNNQGPGSVAGTLAGIPGTLNATAFDANGIPTAVNFTRTTAGSALAIDSSTAFIVDTTDNRQFGTVIFWYGRNNIYTGSFNADVKQALADAIGQLKTVDKRFVVMSILNSNTEVTGSTGYLAIAQFNNDLRALYPRNFIDIRALLVRSGTGTGADATDLANDCTPTSLRADAVHLNTAGYGVVANAIFNFLTVKGWIA